MIHTRVGYAGGHKPNPTYHSIGDHTETLQVDFDPHQISYARLLEVYLQSGNHRRRPWSVQYASILFYHSEEQRQVAEAALARAREGGALYVDLRPLEAFTLAEDYHQKYYLSQTALYREFRKIYPRWQDLTNSRAAARANGYVCGYGSPAEVQANLNRMGLSPQSQELLKRLAGRHQVLCQ